jgi:serine/threonine-protein kinase
MLLQNQTLNQGRFCILHQIKNDGISFDYEAFDIENDKKVIIKEFSESFDVLPTETEVDSINLAFKNKAELLQNLEHKSLLKVHAHIIEGNQRFLVLEKPSGLTLHNLLKRKKSPFLLSEIKKWADQLLAGISYLHSQFPVILHQEITPSNIILDLKGDIKLSLDNFVQNQHLKKSALDNQQDSNSNSLVFSPLEQVWEYLDLASRNVIINNYDEESQKILEKPTDVRSDLYSIGATLYYLSTAIMPDDALTRLIEKMDGNPDPLLPPMDINPSIPMEVSDVILGAMEIKREYRYSSASIMRQILRTALSRVTENEHHSKPVAPIVSIPTPTAPDKIISAPKPEPKLPPATQINNEIDETPVPVKDEVVEVPFATNFQDDELVEVSSAEDNTSRQTNGKSPENDEAHKLELIKKQLREAEEKRRAAEQLVANAEKLLHAQENKKVPPKPQNFDPIPKPDHFAEVTHTESVSIKESTQNKAKLIENISQAKLNKPLFAAISNPRKEEEQELPDSHKSNPIMNWSKPEPFKKEVIPQTDSADLESDTNFSPEEPEVPQISVEPDIQNSDIPSAVEESKVSPKPEHDLKVQNDAEPPVPQKVKHNYQTDNLFNSFEKPDSHSKKTVGAFIKLVLPLIILIIVGGAGWGIFNYTDLLSGEQNEPVETGDQFLTPGKPEAESNPVPITEPLDGQTDNDNELTDPNTSELLPAESEESLPETTTESTVSNPTAPPVVNKKSIKRTPNRTKPVVKPKINNNPPAPPAKKSPPPAPKKKNVTLDDLLKEN